MTRCKSGVIGLTVGVSLLLASVGGAVEVTGAAAATPRIEIQDCGGGVTSVRYLPDPSFNPLAASRESLMAHGYPARPADAADLAVWRKFVARRSLPWTPCDQMTSDARSTASSYTPTPNWAGRVDTGHAYKQVFATWKVPTASMPSSSAYGQSVAWVGIGSGDSSKKPLLQAGSSSYVEGPGSLSYNTWWQVSPRNSVQHFRGPTDAGDTVYAYVEITGSNSATLEVIDETHNSGGIEHYKGSTSTDHQAEWILERPDVSGHRLHALSTAGVHFTSAGAATSTSKSADHAAGAFGGYYDRMHNCADTATLATPAALSNSGFDEVVTRNHYGIGDNCVGP